MGISLNPATLLSGQGINVSSLVQQLLAQKSGALTEWQQEQTTLSTQAGLLQGINNNLANLTTAVNALVDPSGPLAALTATSSQPGIVTATVQTSAAAGTHQIVVNNLATVSSAFTNAIPTGSSVAQGTFTFQVGNGAPVNISVNTSGVTLDQLATYINGQSFGVTATVINDATGSRLSLVSKTPGQAGNLTISGAPGSPSFSGAGNGSISGLVGGSASVPETYTIAATDANHFSVTGSVSGLLGTATAGTAFTSNKIGFTIAAGTVPYEAGDTFTAATTAANSDGLVFQRTAGSNASLTVDGTPISSATNIVTGAIPGVTLNLASAAPGTPVQVTLGNDPTQITGAINNFVSAYNTLVQSINAQFAVDPTTNTQGPLGADSSLRSLQSSLLADVTSSLTGNSGIINLATLGIDLNNDGTLTVNQTATDTHPSLSNVLAANPGAVLSFFQNASGTGFANNFAADLNSLTDPTQGIITSDIAQNTSQARNLTNSINNFQTHLATEQAALTLQLDQVNATLQAYPILLQQVTETLGTLPGSITNGSTTGTTTPTLTSGL